MLAKPTRSLLALFAVQSARTLAFAPSKPSFVAVSKTQLHATPPTMVIYWSIKSAIDLAGYAAGQTDSFKGTGVWSGIEFQRETSDRDERDPPVTDDKPAEGKPNKPTGGK